MKRIAIFASGSGTNAENIGRYFQDKKDIKVTKIYTNKADAGVIERSQSLGIPYLVFTKQSLLDGSLLEDLRKEKIDYIVLAGFLLLIPGNLITQFPGRIINIHPALLPNYGGKGMYGSRVHEAVIRDKQKSSGITIHLVNEVYDDGEILFQKSINLSEKETPESLAAKIHELEYENFPRVVENYITERSKNFQAQ